MTKKFNFRRFLDSSALMRISVFIIVATICLVISFSVINKVASSEDTTYLKALISSIFSLGAVYSTAIWSHEEKNRDVMLHYVTEKRLEWITSTRQLTADFCQYVYEYISVASQKKDSSDTNSNSSVIPGYIVAGKKIKFWLDVKHILKEDKKEAKAEREKLFAQIGATLANLYMHYNFSGERDLILIKTLNSIYKTVKEFRDQYNNSAPEKTEQILLKLQALIIKNLELLVAHSQVYFKVEWERIKNEALYVGEIHDRKKIIRAKLKRDRLRQYKNRSKIHDEFNNIKDLLEIEDNLNRMSLKRTYKKFKNKLESEKYE